MSADFVLRDGGTIIYASPSPGVSTAVGDFPGLALMDLMKPYMPATPENYQRVLKDIHAREIQMWAGLHLGADLRGDDAQAPEARHARGEPRAGGRHRHGRDHVARRGVRRGDGAARAATRRCSCCRTRATSCRATSCAWRPSRCASRRRCSRTDAALRPRRRSGARRRRRRSARGRDPGLDHDRRAAADVSRTARPARCSRRSRCRAPTAAAPSTSR